MGLMRWVFGSAQAQHAGRVVEQVGGVFRANAEASAVRSFELDSATLAQYAGEFHVRQNRTLFDSLVDGLNRLVRPVITLSILGVLPAAMVWPEKLAVALNAIQVLPAGYWALLSIIVGFYFGGRMQIKAQDFEKSVADAAIRAPKVIENMRQKRDNLSPNDADAKGNTVTSGQPKELPKTENQAVLDWRKSVE